MGTILLAAIAGCNYQPAPKTPGPSAATPAAPTAPVEKSSPAPPVSTAAAAASPDGVPGAANATPPNYPAAAPTSPPSSPAAAAPATYSVQLSAGVVTPLPTVEGTRIGFSVDYQYSGAGGSPMQAVWVIQRAKGNPARLKVQLQASGTLETLVAWPPDEGPYQCRIEDAYGRPLSADAPMR